MGLTSLLLETCTTVDPDSRQRKSVNYAVSTKKYSSYDDVYIACCEGLKMRYILPITLHYFT